MTWQSLSSKSNKAKRKWILLSCGTLISHSHTVLFGYVLGYPREDRVPLSGPSTLGPQPSPVEQQKKTVWVSRNARKKKVGVIYTI